MEDEDLMLLDPTLEVILLTFEDTLSSSGALEHAIGAAEGSNIKLWAILNTFEHVRPPGLTFLEVE
jgi:hypothetical protein